MNTSPTIGQWAKAMALAQARMKPARRNAENPNFGSRYADQYAVHKAVAKPLHDHGLAYVQGEKVVDGRVVVATRITHSQSGEWVETYFALVLPERCPAHDYAAAFTYASRIGLAKACGLAIDEDDDGNRASARTGRAAGGGGGAPSGQPGAAGNAAATQANNIIARARKIENSIDLREFIAALPPLDEEHPAVKGMRRFLEQRLRTLDARARAA